MFPIKSRILKKRHVKRRDQKQFFSVVNLFRLEQEEQTEKQKKNKRLSEKRAEKRCQVRRDKGQARLNMDSKQVQEREIAKIEISTSSKGLQL